MLPNDLSIAVHSACDDLRFWGHVVRRGACWEYVGCRDRQGYGKVLRNGKAWFAHRYAWTLTNGPIPAGGVVRHSCDNPPCVNPAHLLLGTQGDNISDRQARGRHRPGRLLGEAHPSSRLTEGEVIELREAREAGVSLTVLAKRYGVTKRHVYQVATRRLWKHIG
jgi:hypothetical protein